MNNSSFHPRRLFLPFVLAFLALAGGCKKKLMQDLPYDGTHYLDQGKPFTGRAYTTFNGQGMAGKNSGYFTFTGGIPRGNFITCGPAGEIIKYGRFRPVSDTATLHLLSKDLQRINLSYFRIIDYSGRPPADFVNIFLIPYPNEARSIEGTDSGAAFKRQVMDRLLEKKMLDTDDNRKINEIVIAGSEF